MSRRKPGIILMAEDDHEDRLLAREAMTESGISADFRFVDDGEELLEYLRVEGSFAAAGAAPRPGLILLDLKMPRKNGFEVLAEIRSDPALRHIPVVVLTTSSAEDDVLRSYELGGNSFITKPITFTGLVNVMRNIGEYWLRTVELPHIDA